MRTRNLHGGFIRSMVTACALGIAAPAALAQAAPLTAEQVERLKQELDAQLAINRQLRGRVEALEKRLAAEGRGEPARALDPTAVRPPAALDAESASAIEQALGAKGLELLPSGAVRITPAVTLATAGSGVARQDTQVYSLAADVGLPAGFMLSARVPYVRQDSDALGNRRGRGDLSLGLSRKFLEETDSRPSVIGRIGYSRSSSNNLSEPTAVGSGFDSWDIGLSAVKRMSPLVVYGGTSFAHVHAETGTMRDPISGVTTFTGRIAPGNSANLNGGISLAATPDVSLDAGLTFNFFRPTRFEPTVGAASSVSRHSEGYLTLGTGFVLRKDLFLTLNAAAGVTSDAAKFIFSVALPYRF